MKRLAALGSALLAMIATPALAQDVVLVPKSPDITLQVAPGEAPPTATVEDMDWLLGEWTGQGIGGAPAKESWIRGADGILVGTFVQQTAEGGIMFTEHMYIVEQGGSLVLKLKHFNADLTGWEEKDEMLTFPLAALQPCLAQFAGLTFSCIARDHAARGLFIAVKMREGGELTFTFRRADLSVAPQCENLFEREAACYAGVLERSDGVRGRYLTAAIEHQTALATMIAERGYLAEPDPDGLPDLSNVERIRASEAAFLAYREAECGAADADLRDGAPQTARTLSCAISLNQERTHAIWRQWLAGTETTPSVLPEPRRAH